MPKTWSCYYNYQGYSIDVRHSQWKFDGERKGRVKRREETENCPWTSRKKCSQNRFVAWIMEPLCGWTNHIWSLKDTVSGTLELQDHWKDAQVWIWGIQFPIQKYGIIKSVRVIRDQDDQSRGYGFVEFDNKDDFVTAYKNANYRKIDGHKIIVDYERGIFLKI